MNYCFTPCDVDHSNNHFVVRDPFQFSCYIYNNGQPSDPNVTPVELVTLLTDLRLFVFKGSDAPPIRNRICTGLKIGDDTLESLAGQLSPGLSNSKPPFYCLPFCDEFNFQDYETTDNPAPCYIEYHGTMMETLVSRLTRLIEPAVENEKEICPFTGLNDDRNNCRSSISRMCRANRKVRKQNKMPLIKVVLNINFSRRVYELPPGESSCFIYLNGPAAAIGVVAATGLSGVMSTGGTLLGSAGLFSLLYAGRNTFRACPPSTCRSRNGSGRCCPFVIFRGRPRCPRSC